jgi:sialic acid synthase SpsE
MTHTVKIGKFEIGPDRPIFVTAEIGINHIGDIEKLKHQSYLAKHRGGCDAVKIQTRINTKGNLFDVYSPEMLAKPRKEEVPRFVLEMAIRRGVYTPEDIERLTKCNFEEPTEHDQKRAIELLPYEIAIFLEHATSLGLLAYSTPWCLGAVEVLENLGVPCYKIGSPDATDDELIGAVVRTGKPVLIATGGMDQDMADHIVDVVREHGGADRFILMQCTSYYNPEVANDHGRSLLGVRVIANWVKRYAPIPIGFSNNSTGIFPSHSAANQGAVAIEQHFTDWRAQYGSDQKSSIEYGKMAELTQALKELPAVLGDGIKRFHPEEATVMKKLRRVGRKEP